MGVINQSAKHFSLLPRLFFLLLKFSPPALSGHFKISPTYILVKMIKRMHIILGAR